MPGRLYLIPTPIDEAQTAGSIPADMAGVVAPLRSFVVERESTAQKFLKKINREFPFTECRFRELSEHTSPSEVKEICAEIRDVDTGLLSESGVPCVADPGASAKRNPACAVT